MTTIKQIYDLLLSIFDQLMMLVDTPKANPIRIKPTNNAISRKGCILSMPANKKVIPIKKLKSINIFWSLGFIFTFLFMIEKRMN